MIEINLLPEEMRPKEATAVPYASVVLAGGTAVILAAGGLVAYYLMNIQPLREERNQARAAQERAARELRDLEALQKRHEQEIKRRDEALKVKAQRLLWSGVLDDLWTAVYERGDVWIQSLVIEEEKGAASRSRGKNDPPRVVLKVALQGTDFGEEADEYSMVSEKRLADFLETLMGQPGFQKEKTRPGFVVGEWARSGLSVAEEGGDKRTLASEVAILREKPAASAPPARAGAKR